MKRLIFAAIVLSFMISCNGQDSSNTKKSELEKKVSKRDYSITAENAYNNLFFDSAALEKYFIDNNPGDSLVRRMRSFYNTRNYQFAWFSPEGLTEQARGFWNLHNYHTTYANDSLLKDKALKKKMDALIDDNFTVSAGDKSFINTELKLTHHFILYTLNAYEDGYVKRKEMERFVPRRKEDPIKLADSLINKKHKDEKYYDDVNENYKRLKLALAQYLNVHKQGGWPQVPADAKQLKAGSNSNTVSLLKKRLQLSGDMPGTDTTAIFNDSLKIAIAKFQERHGYTADGKLTERQLKDMNIPLVSRIQQILINMGRMQWLVNNPSGKLIVVNIPEFVLHVTEDGAKVREMPVVVGKEGHNTVMFTGNMNQVVFSPYWNVPPSIVKSEILPAMESNPAYLESQDMEITGDDGGLPSIRQRPGGKNALGKVKFLFPNSFNIYFHDTQAKSLFKNDKRAYSHGCIRLSDPAWMANYVLKDTEWTPSKIDAAMNAGTEQFVKLKKPIPVIITYYTAWVDEAGVLHFADDIYNHDSDLVAKMF